MDTLIKDVYYNLSSPACYSGVYTVYKEAKKHNPIIKFSDVQDFLRTQDTYTLHKPIVRKFQRNKTIASGIDSDWQADLCDMQKIKKYNDGYAYILTVIDVLSKMAWAVPVKNKKPETCADAFTHILKSSQRQPWRLLTDKGLEFLGRPFQNFLKKHDIQFIASESPDIKASIAERYNRTLKTKLWKHFSTKSTFRYIDVLPKIVDSINHSYHRSIKRKPVDVNVNNAQDVWETLYGSRTNLSRQVEYKFDINDKVRIAQYKHVFKKGYLPKFTEEIFVVTDQLSRNPPVYKIKDLNEEPVSGVFCEQELVKIIKPDDIYKIEKIIRKRKTKNRTEYLVKWQGYPDSFNQWIPQSELKTI